MLPAQQGLETHHLATAQVDLGLVVQTQLIVGDCLPDPGQRLLHRFLLNVLQHVKPVVAVAPVLLGHVQGLVGMAQQSVGVRAIGRENGETQAASDANVVAIQLKGLGQGVQNALEQASQISIIGQVFKQDDKFVATQTGQGVNRAQFLVQSHRECHQQRVTHGMTIGIVDRLEFIQVQQAHRQFGAISLGFFKCPRKTVGQQHPIGQASERIMASLPLQALLHLLTLRHIAQHQHTSQCVA